MSKFNKTCWKFCAHSFSLYGKIFKSIQDVQMFWELIEVHKFNLSLQNCIWWLHFKGLYLLHHIFVLNKICLDMFPLNSSYCGIIFISIQGVWNVWEQFEVQNPDIFGLHWTLVAYFFFIQCPFLINKNLEKLHILV